MLASSLADTGTSACRIDGKSAALPVDAPILGDQDVDAIRRDLRQHRRVDLVVLVLVTCAKLRDLGRVRRLGLDRLVALKLALKRPHHFQVGVLPHFFDRVGSSSHRNSVPMSSRTTSGRLAHASNSQRAKQLPASTPAKKTAASDSALRTR